MKTIPLKAVVIQPGEARDVRRASRVPCVVYGKKFANKYLSLDFQEFHKAYHKAGHSTIIDLDTGAEKIPVLIHDIQRHPLTNDYTHVDFSVVRQDQEIHTHIPIHLYGESDAVKLLHGILVHGKDSVEVKCLPKYLVSEIRVDVSPIKDFHTAITIGDLNLPKEIHVLDNLETVVASVSAPKIEVEEPKAEEVPATEAKEEKKEE